MSYGRPIVATSLNMAGEESLTNLNQLSEKFKQNVDIIIDEGETKIGMPSTIIKVEDEHIVILRQGPIKFER